MSSSVCVMGLWHLGCVTAACLSKNHPIIGFDPDKKVIENLQHGTPPIMEPGLAELIAASTKANNLSFSADLASSARASDILYITFDTPVDADDKVDLGPIERTIDSLLPFLEDRHLLVLSSQIPVGTSRRLLGKIRAAGKKCGLCYSPENLRLGTALDVFMHPERVVLGISDDVLKPRLEELFSGVGGERLYMDLESAEMTKHAMNAYLATLISFSGEISDLCEQSGANAISVMNALRKEKRVSPHAPIMPGLGFGGGTLARDVQILRALGKQKSTPTPMLDSTFQSNRERMHYVPRKLKEVLGSLSGKTIAFFGLTYKPGTDTLRRSLALDVIDELKASGAGIQAYDPAINCPITTHPQVKICSSAKEAASGADAIVLTTAWDEFKALDWTAIAPAMRTPILIDARNALDTNLTGPTMRYYGIGVVHASK